MSWERLKGYLKRPAMKDASLIVISATVINLLYTFLPVLSAVILSSIVAIILAIVGFWLTDKRDRQTEQILKDLQQAIQEARDLEARLRELKREIQQAENRLARLVDLERSGPPRTSSTDW
jgi:biopolymer transport protein ExbB/TolQ